MHNKINGYKCPNIHVCSPYPQWKLLILKGYQQLPYQLNPNKSTYGHHNIHHSKIIYE